MRILLLSALILLLHSCGISPKEKPKTQVQNHVPEWSKNVIWYQIFADRFRNGDPSNDPKPEDLTGAYPFFVPEGWQVTPWGQDWYREDDYLQNVTEAQKAKHNGFNGFSQKSQLRRYGGDLQGVLDKLDYLQNLGITGIYFNPLNDAPSLHKYDARNWRHIDVNFGPDPEGDKKIMASENPADPSTWKLTAADKMFLKVIEECHKRGIRVILDYSWNHTGITFWAWQDILKNQKNSVYADWYWINQFDNPATPENEFDYKGWLGVPSLPEIKETVPQNHAEGIRAFEGNITNEDVKNLIFAITERWLDPDGDGNPADGVDGYRLDVAAEVPLGFWREYREKVRSVNPEAFILGEVWYEQFPDKLLNPEPFLRGDIFDAVMNYRWYRAARSFFSQPHENMTPTVFADSLNSIRKVLQPGNNQAMMNMVSGHDSPRVLTSLFNKNKYKFEANPEANSSYKIHKPDAETYQTFKMLLAHQFTWIGSPNIWQGDEMGMWGADDPNNRKPLIWKDIEFEDESAHPLNMARPVDQVKFNQEIHDYYKKLIQIRKDNPVLADGFVTFLITDDAQNVLAYARQDASSHIIVVFNNSEAEQSIQLDGIYTDLLTGEKADFVNNEGFFPLKPKNAYIFKSEK